MPPPIQAPQHLAPIAPVPGTRPQQLRDAAPIAPMDALETRPQDLALAQACNVAPPGHHVSASLGAPVGAHLPSIPRNLGHHCPITLEPIDDIDDAVLAEDGHIYARFALLAYMSTSLSSRSPMTRVDMPETRYELFGDAPLHAAAAANIADARGAQAPQRLAVRDMMGHLVRHAAADIDVAIEDVYRAQRHNTALILVLFTNLYCFETGALNALTTAFLPTSQSARAALFLLSGAGIGLCMGLMLNNRARIRELHQARAML